MRQGAIEIVADPDELPRLAAEKFLHSCISVVQRKRVFAVALSGGSTPKPLYELLANPDEQFCSQLPWQQIHFFWSDERHVPPDHPESNYRMAKEAMLLRVPVPQENVHRFRSEEESAAAAAEMYERTLRDFFELAESEVPEFDLILLGLGTDGHTASIFPGSGVLKEKTRLVTAPWVEKHQSYRLTLTPLVLNNAALVMFLVSGSEKAETLRQVLEGNDDPERLPAQIVNPRNGSLVWLVDSAAARDLRNQK